MKIDNKGGILLTTLLFFFLFSFIFTILLEDFQLTQRFNQNSKEYYVAKIMVSMCLYDLKQAEQLSEEGEGVCSFSAGKVSYRYLNHQVFLTVKTHRQTYKFQEYIKK